MTILDVRHLHVQFNTGNGILHAVNDVSLSVAEGETLAMVGESGCGKSTTALAILRLLGPNARQSGSIQFQGTNISNAGKRELRGLRGSRIGMIFQEPSTSLNPLMRVGDQVAETISRHTTMTPKQIKFKVVDLFQSIGIADPATTARRFPHELSGGMNQRVVIAMAIACKPKLIIADEPTTALDVTIQAQILELLRDLRRLEGTALLLVTHDLGVVAETADRVMVMYAGTKVEEAHVSRLFHSPAHPYTAGHLNGLPKRSDESTAPRPRLQEIPGSVPSLMQPPTICPFFSRCYRAADVCERNSPPVTNVGQQHIVACHLP